MRRPSSTTRHSRLPLRPPGPLRRRQRRTRFNARRPIRRRIEMSDDADLQICTDEQPFGRDREVQCTLTLAAQIPRRDIGVLQQELGKTADQIRQTETTVGKWKDAQLARAYDLYL